MHINLRQHADEYSVVESLHINQCEQCQTDIKTLDQLHQSAKEMPVIEPNELNWQSIKLRTENKKIIKLPQKNKINRPFIYQNLSALAASTFFIAVGWLVWNNHQLQNQLEQVLLTNQQLELKLVSPTTNTYQQVFFVKKINELDQKLQNVSSLEQQVTLLEKRTVLVLELYKTQQGISDVFSI